MCGCSHTTLGIHRNTLRNFMRSMRLPWINMKDLCTFLHKSYSNHRLSYFAEMKTIECPQIVHRDYNSFDICYYNTVVRS